MSMDDSATARRRRLVWPMSPINLILVSVVLVGAIICFAVGNIVAGVILLVSGIGVAIGAIAARRGTSGDLERVNALEYADERDRQAGIKGLATVGGVALILGATQLVIFTVAQADALTRGVALWSYIALIAIWFFANWFFVRRG